MDQNKKIPVIVPAILIMATSVGILSTDLYAPSLPHLPEILGSDPSTIQLTMSLNVLAFGLAQLVIGPLADRFGRRPVLLTGMVLFALFSIACTFATSAGELITARIFQGIAASSEAVVVLAMIRDLWKGKAAVRIMGIYGMTIALAPAIGPVIGGYMHVLFGWQSNFYLLAGCIGVVMVTGWRYLPESTTPDLYALEPHRLFSGYRYLLLNREYMTYAIIMAAIMGALFAFITAAPFVLIDQMGVPTENFGFYQAAMVLTYFFGSMYAARAIEYVSIDPLLRIGLVLSSAGGLMLLGIAILHLETPVLVTASMCFYAFGIGLVFATGPLKALEATSGGTGQAAALLGTFEMLGAGLGSYSVSVFYDGTVWPMAINVAGLAVLAWIIYEIVRPWKHGEDIGILNNE